MMRFYLSIWMLFASGYAFAQTSTRDVYMCKLATLKLKAESSGASRYEWYRNNEIVVGSGSYELVVSEEGTYKAFGINEDGCMSTESINIIVKHHKPSAIDDIGSGVKNNKVILDVLKNDLSVCADFDAATLAVVQQPASGTVVKVDGKLQFSPQTDFTGTATFTYTVTDTSGVQANVANVKVDITASPLPVTLTYFEVTKIESFAQIDWQTSLEENSDYFDIERSTDAQGWTKIARLAAGFESKAARYYTHNDSLPESGLNYYRLKMVDANETFTYSRIKSVHFPEFSWAEVYPNPVDDQLYIVIRNKKVKNLRMISNSGIVRLSQEITVPSFIVSMKQYPTGMYYLHFEQDDGTVKIYKLMHN